MAKLEQHLDALLDDYRRGYTPLPNDDFAFERDARALQGRLLARVAPDDFDDFSAALDVGVDLPDDESGETRLVCVNNFPEFIQYYLRFRLRQCFRQFVDERREKVKTIEDADLQKHADEDFPPEAAQAFGGPSTIPEDLSDDYSTPRLNFLKPKSERSSNDRKRVSGKTVVRGMLGVSLAVFAALGIMVVTMPSSQEPPAQKKKADKMTPALRRQLDADTRLIKEMEREPKHQAGAYEARAVTYLSVEYYQEAIADLQAAIRLLERDLANDVHDARRNRLVETEQKIGNIHLRTQNHPQAIDAYDRAIGHATHPQRTSKTHSRLFVYQDRGHAKQAMDRWHDALQDFILAIESDNGFPDAIHGPLANDIAVCLRNLGRKEEASRWASIASGYEANAVDAYRFIRAALPNLKRKP